ncbi:hypothetical protein NQ318_007374 [Aromia moschata]|uniref:Serpin domain-containing protein n=1 Tax=Aromia moschata TaxID=1265417 RepID=A0AAV8YF16_9CUCU|nr:hypothetical protein NQ318_007374 [Aromia moschata]
MYAITLSLMLATAAHVLHAQDNKIYFPDDDMTDIEIRANLSEIRGTQLYDQHIEQIMSEGISKLTLAINKILLQFGHKENHVFAPVSIAAALALVLLGSNGKTFEEILNTWGLATGVDVEKRTLQVHQQFGRMISKLESTAGFDMDQQVNFAAAIFIQDSYPIRNAYKRVAEDLYESEIFNVDFVSNPVEAQRSINHAMYFKASWEHPFFEGATARRPFYVNGRDSQTDIEVEMMANGGEFPYFKDQGLGCEIMGFPYRGRATTMYVVMPFDSDVSKLKALEDKLTPSNLEHLANSTLKPVLQRLGIRTLFVPSQANLALLSPGEQVTQKLPSKVLPVVGIPLKPNSDEEIVVFNRFGANCSATHNSSTKRCSSQDLTDQYNRIGARVSSRVASTKDIQETLENLRQIVSKQSTTNDYQNPRLYADKVVHKVFMDITETGTEAAATTSISLSRDGGG